MKHVGETGKKKRRKCPQCGAVLAMSDPGTLCFVCQDKESERLMSGDSPTYDVQDMARILRLENEQVRRLARKGKLPHRIPAVRKLLWHRETVDRWIKSGGQLSEESVFEIAALAASAYVQRGWASDKVTGQLIIDTPVVMFPVGQDGRMLKPTIYTLAMAEHPESP